MAESELMKYRINWTDRVGYYTYIDADTPKEAVEILRDGVDSMEPCGFCETEIGSIEVYDESRDTRAATCLPVLTEDDTDDTLMRRMLHLWPSAELGEDSDGQLIIYTGMRHTEDGVRVVSLEDGVTPTD